MIDKDIIKALEEYSQRGFTFYNIAMPEFARCILSLINRQQAEIEALQKVVIDDYATEYDNKIKAEAVKEFAERLKNKIKIECNPYGKPTFDYDTSIAIMRYIDNLVKGMVGEKNENIRNYKGRN